MGENSDRVEFQTRENGFKNRLFTFAIVDKEVRVEIMDFLVDAYHIYEREINRALELHHMIKSMTVLAIEFEKKVSKVNESLNVNDTLDIDESDTTMIIKETLFFPSPNTIIGLDSDLNAHYNLNVINELLNDIENAAHHGSGFTISRIIELTVQVCSYEPLNGGSYVQTPKVLERKKAIVNVKNNNDNMCFKWAVLSCIHQTEQNPQRLSNYKKYENELNFNGIEFPVGMKDIDKFVKQNEGISINVYYYDEDLERVCPLRVSSTVREKHIHLLLLIGKNRMNTNGAETTAGKIKVVIETDQIRMHYCWIKNLSRLVSRQLSSYAHRLFICDRCLNYFISETNLIEHREECRNECQISMPIRNGFNSRIIKNS